VAVCLGWQVAPSRASDAQKQFLLIYSSENQVVAIKETTDGFRETLTQHYQGEWDALLYVEHLDLDRFPTEAHRRNVRDFLSQKYKDTGIDVVIAGGSIALAFVLEHASMIAPNADLVFGGQTKEALARLELPPDASGVLTEYDIANTVHLARQLQPDATRVVVFGGSAQEDRFWLAAAKAALVDIDTEIPVEYVTDLTIDAFVETAKGLEPDAILLFLPIREDADGRRLQPGQPLDTISSISNAPVYTVFSPSIGRGPVGGVVAPFRKIGEEMAKVAIATADGSDALPRVISSQMFPVIDYRQLQRYGLDPGLLPPNAIIENFVPSLLGKYKIELMVAAAVALALILAAATVATVERRRRVLATTLANERLELAHLARISQLGVLSGALAHELTQPLNAILHNAETARRILQSGLIYEKEIRDIVDEILDDDRRATRIIQQMRKLFIKGTVELKPVDLDSIVRSVMRIMRAELKLRNVTVELGADGRPVMVAGNEQQLQQILINLLLNSAEALSDIPASDRRVRLELFATPDQTAVLSARDWGPGIPEDSHKQIFDPFFSSKSEGVGIGLSICRWIADAHGGTIEIDAGVENGTRIFLTLPLSDVSGEMS
jgi:signal transduction histidine kinase